VHAPGAQENNVPPLPGGRSSADYEAIKIAYQRSFRFSIAFENASLPGYTTEKLLDALLAGTIPIYWGNPRVDDDVPAGSYVNAHDFSSLAELADHVLEVDADEHLAAGYLGATAKPRVGAAEMKQAICDLFAEAADHRPSRRSSLTRPVSLLAHGGAGELVRKGTRSARYRLTRLLRRPL
jgi:alpha(1,3/1,4) fucosyltransferase